MPKPKIMKRFHIIRTVTNMEYQYIEAMTKSEAVATLRAGTPCSFKKTKWKVVGTPVELRGHPRSEG